MGVVSIVREAMSLGIRLWVADDRIIYHPKSAAPIELVERLKENKSELIEYLNDRQTDKDSQARKMLAWAAELGNRDLVIEVPITFNETCLRQVTTGRISEYARQYLRTVASAEMAKRGLNWEPWTLEWHEEQGKEAMQSLANMRAAMEERE